jgi:hypothetical protein
MHVVFIVRSRKILDDEIEKRCRVGSFRRTAQMIVELGDLDEGRVKLDLERSERVPRLAAD